MFRVYQAGFETIQPTFSRELICGDIIRSSCAVHRLAHQVT